MMNNRPSLTVMPRTRRRGRRSNFWLIVCLLAVAIFVVTLAVVDEDPQRPGQIGFYGAGKVMEKIAG